MNQPTNRRWLLARRPAGHVRREDFVLERSEVPERVDPATVLVRHELLLCAPTIRNWISGERNSYYPTVELGAPVLAPAGGRIVASDDPAWPVGTRVTGFGSWQDYQWVDPAGLRAVPDHVATQDAIGMLGMNALTAYFGVMAVGRLRPDETLLVSGAAGSVGSVAAQVGRALGARVVALCGSADKARWLREACRIEAVIDYRNEDVPERLAALCPDGVDVVFDNVGGEFLHQALAHTNRHGRIALCGQIATYDVADPHSGRPLDMMRIIYGGITLRGFLVGEFADEWDTAADRIAAWVAERAIAHREDVRDGFDQLPETFAALFDGSNQGTLIARIADEEGHAL